MNKVTTTILSLGADAEKAIYVNDQYRIALSGKSLSLWTHDVDAAKWKDVGVTVDDVPLDLSKLVYRCSLPFALDKNLLVFRYGSPKYFNLFIQKLPLRQELIKEVGRGYFIGIMNFIGVTVDGQKASLYTDNDGTQFLYTFFD